MFMHDFRQCIFGRIVYIEQMHLYFHFGALFFFHLVVYFIFLIFFLFARFFIVVIWRFFPSI